MITWIRQEGGFDRNEDGRTSREVFIEVLDGPIWSDAYRARFPYSKAVEIVEEGISKAQLRFAGYRLVPATPQKENTDMAKKEKVTKKVTTKKTPAFVLAAFIDGPFKITATHKGKEFEAKVNTDGSITFDGEIYKTPSGAAKAAIKGSVDGWRFWEFTKDNAEVALDELRGKKSPLKAAVAA